MSLILDTLLRSRLFFVQRAIIFRCEPANKKAKHTPQHNTHTQWTRSVGLIFCLGKKQTILFLAPALSVWQKHTRRFRDKYFGLYIYFHRSRRKWTSSQSKHGTRDREVFWERNIISAELSHMMRVLWSRIYLSLSNLAPIRGPVSAQFIHCCDWLKLVEPRAAPRVSNQSESLVFFPSWLPTQTTLCSHRLNLSTRQCKLADVLTSNTSFAFRNANFLSPQKDLQAYLTTQVNLFGLAVWC